jgi:hypothetical protein
MSSPSYRDNRDKRGAGIDAMKTELHRLLDKKYPTTTNDNDIKFLMSSLVNKLQSRSRHTELQELKDLYAKYNAAKRGASGSTRKNRKSKKQRKNRKTRRN